MPKGKVFTREGRTIYVDGKPFVYISREGDTQPVVADYVARLILDFLNKSRDAKAAAKGYDEVKKRRNF